MAVLPRVEINLEKIRHNAKTLKQLFGRKGISITGVVKGVTADLNIAGALVEAGITSLADSKIANIEKMRKAGIKADLILLRSPGISEVEKTVRYADISMNTELDTIRALSAEAVRQQKTHKIILMVEMGDLREGILLKDAPAMIREIFTCPGIELAGIGTNFACFGGVLPTEQKMQTFSRFVQAMQELFSLKLPYVSGGNSANYNWAVKTKDAEAVNNVRLGESILLGRETSGGHIIPSLYQDAFCFVAEVIESKIKPSVPYGTIGKNAFGEQVTFIDRGNRRRTIISAGRHDVLVSGLTPVRPFHIIGSSSDHIILDTKDAVLAPGDEVRFYMNYGAMLRAMTSPYVYKTYVHGAATTEPYKQQFLLSRGTRQNRPPETEKNPAN